MMPQFLVDEPANPESNEYEVHDAIADAIKGEITRKTSNNSGRRIAIIGEWGSGKSTIIKFLQNRFILSGDDSGAPVVFVVFDLWSHTGEALRRSFLQKLFNELEDSFGTIALPTEWLELKQKLKYEERTVLETNSQNYSPMAVFLIALVALYAAFGALGGAIAPLLQAEILSCLIPWSKAFQILLTAICAMSFGLCSVKGDEGDKGLKYRFKSFFGSFKNGLSQVVAHLNGNPVCNTTTTTQSQVMGSLVFEEYLAEMMTIATQLMPNQKTVVILDNLDRLSAQHLRNAWDNIQLFANYMDQNRGAAKDMWLILPVSEDTIRHLFDVDKNEKCEKQTLSKLFIIQYRLPKPIKSEWKKSTSDFIEKAFPGVTSNEMHDIIAVMNCYENPSRLNNPREQKRVINEHVAMRQVYPMVRIDSIAVYLFLRDRYEQIPDDEKKLVFESWVTSQLSQASIGSILPMGVNVDFNPAEISMLTFGVLDKERAQEAMLANGLSDIGFLQELDLNHYIQNGTGSWEVIQDCISHDAVGVESQNARERYIELVKRVDEVTPEDENGQMEKNRALCSLSVFLNECDWPPIEGSAQAVNAMADASNRKEGLVGEIIAAVNHSAAAFQKLEEQKKEIWGNEVSEFVQHAISRGIHIENGSIEIDAGDDLYPMIESIASKEDSVAILKVFTFTGDEALKILLSSVVANRPSENNPAVASTFPHVNLLDLENVQEVPASYSSYGLSPDEGIVLFYELWAGCQYYPALFAVNYLRNAIQQNYFGNDIFLKAESPNEYAAAIAQFIQRDLATFNDSGCEQFANSLKNSLEMAFLAARQFVFKADELLDDNRLDDIISAVDKPNTHTLACNLLSVLFNCAESPLTFPARAGQKLLSLSENSTNSTMIADMANLYGSNDLMTCGFDSTSIPLYLRVLRDDDSNDYAKWLRNGLTGLPYEYWDHELKNISASVPFDLLDSLFKEGLPENFEDAFSDWSENIDAIGEDQRLSSLLCKLSDTAFTRISDQLVELFNNGSDWKSRLSSYGNILLSRNWLTSRTFEEQISIGSAILDSSLALPSTWLRRAYEAKQIESEVAIPLLDKARKMLARKDTPKKVTFKNNAEALVSFFEKAVTIQQKKQHE